VVDYIETTLLDSAFQIMVAAPGKACCR